MHQEIPLRGGNVSTVVRVGETVRRNAGPWTPTVHALLRPGGRLVVIEPNGRGPLGALHSWLVPAESAIRQSTPERVAALLDGLPLAGR